MISVAGFEELQNSAREQLGAAATAAPPPWADDAPLSNGLRLSFGTADGDGAYQLIANLDATEAELGGFNFVLRRVTEVARALGYAPRLICRWLPCSLLTTTASAWPPRLASPPAIGYG